MSAPRERLTEFFRPANVRVNSRSPTEALKRADYGEVYTMPMQQLGGWGDVSGMHPEVLVQPERDEEALLVEEFTPVVVEPSAVRENRLVCSGVRSTILLCQAHSVPE